MTGIMFNQSNGAFRRLVSLFLLMALAVACSRGGTQEASEQPAGTPGTAAVDPSDGPLPEVASPYDALPAGSRGLLDEPFSGDLGEMMQRRIIRAGVTFNRTHYYIDKGEQRGLAYESLRSFEEEINKRFKTGLLKVHVAFVPVARDELVPALLAGRVDLVAAQLTVTPERQRLVDFTTPVRTGVTELVVTGPGAPSLKTVEDLSGHMVFVRESSSYRTSLDELNRRLQAAGRPPVVIRPAPESLEDDDILEMVNAGLVPITVVDDYLVEFWQQLFPAVTSRADLAVRTGAEIAVAVRKQNPELKAAGNDWIRAHGPRTAFGNVLNKRYLASTSFARSATSESERQKFQELVALFRKYAGQYDIDFVLMAAQGYQESRLDQSVRSRVGAVGVMQVMPRTGDELAVGDIHQIEPNIHAGVKYIRKIIDTYLSDEAIDPLNRTLLAFAAYNAGPGRLRQLRDQAAKQGLDPNVWFHNVERIASERIGRETVQYVSNIFKYYVAYRLALEEADARTRAKKSSGS